jgi:hypothetical protein
MNKCALYAKQIKCNKYYILFLSSYITLPLSNRFTLHYHRIEVYIRRQHRPYHRHPEY